MTIEKCINEFDVNDVIFEEGSTGRELFVVLDGTVEIAKMNGASKTVIVTLGKGEFFPCGDHLGGGCGALGFIHGIIGERDSQTNTE